MTVGLLCQYDGDGFVVARRHKKEADATYVIGAHYIVTPEEIRSEAAHRSFFASVAEAWRNLPDDQTERFPSPESLRKYALIKTGFCVRRDVVCANNNQALALAALVRELDSYSLVTVSERVVSTWTAESQKYRAMGKKRFHESQAAVREYVAGLLNVTANDLPESEAA